MSQLIVMAQETNTCASDCQRKLSTVPPSIWIFQVWEFFAGVRKRSRLMVSHQPLHALWKHGWFVYLFMHHCAPPHLLFLFWQKIVLDYFDTFFVFCWKPVSCGEDYTGKYISFRYKAPKPLNSEKCSWLKKENCVNHTASIFHLFPPHLSHPE